MNIIDVVCIAVIIIIIAVSARKGFLLSLFNIAAYIAAGIAAKILSLPLSMIIYNNYINKRIISALYEIMPSGSINGELSVVMENILESLPPYVSAFIRQFDVIPDFSAAPAGGQFTVEIIESEYLKPIVTNIMSIVVIVLLFVLFSVILKIVLHFINNMLTAKKHGMISKTNSFLGALLGLIKGIVPSGLICALLTITAPVINNENLFVLVNGSYFCKIISDILS